MTTCPDCRHDWTDHLHGLDDGGGAGCYHRIDRLDENQSIDRPDHEGPEWCPCTKPPPVDLDTRRPADLALATVSPIFDAVRSGFEGHLTAEDIAEINKETIAELTPVESEAGGLLFPCMLSMGDRTTILKALHYLYPHLGERLADLTDRLMSIPTPADVAKYASMAAVEIQRATDAPAT